MASRGFQSDNLTMLMLMGAGVLLWQKVSGVAEKVGKKLEIGENSGGPLQSETTAEINQYEAEVKSWHCDWLKLPKKKAYYQSIANKIYTHIKDHKGYIENIDEDYLIGLCRPLTTNELRAVAISFGVKDFNNFFGFTSFTGHIFHLFDKVLTDSFIGGNDLTEMKKIWSPTGLWV